jgi:hypothetical protein
MSRSGLDGRRVELKSTSASVARTCLVLDGDPNGAGPQSEC